MAVRRSEDEIESSYLAFGQGEPAWHTAENQAGSQPPGSVPHEPAFHTASYRAYGALGVDRAVRSVLTAWCGLQKSSQAVL